MRCRDFLPGGHGDVVRRHPARPSLDVHDDQRPGGHSVLLLRRRSRETGRPDRQAPWHGAERHPQGVHGPACVGLSGRASAQSHRGHVRVGRQAHTALEYDFDLRLSHPRGGGDGGPGARVHARERLHLCGARHRARSRYRQLRRAPFLLLGHPQRLLRGDRQAACRPAHLGAPHARALQGPASPLLDDALSQPDGGCHTDRAAAVEQHRACRVSGPGRGARRHAIASHQFPG